MPRLELDTGQGQESLLRLQVGKPYDPISILYFFGPGWQDPEAWNCAELIAASFVQGGLIPPAMAARYGRVTVQGAWLLASMAGGGAHA